MELGFDASPGEEGDPDAELIHARSTFALRFRNSIRSVSYLRATRPAVVVLANGRSPNVEGADRTVLDGRRWHHCRGSETHGRWHQYQYAAPKISADGPVLRRGAQARWAAAA